MTQRLLIYTDLDGTLLDHHSYSHAPADALLAELEQAQIPVIPCTSKTRAELLHLRESLHNRHPFIIENGAAVCLPAGYLQHPPDDCESTGELLIKPFVAPRAHWLAMLDRIRPAYPDCRGFSEMDLSQIVALTGLSKQQAGRAAQREYGEPIHCPGPADQCQRLIAELHAAGGRVLTGGRFLHLSGHCDKGKALRWLNRQFATEWGVQPISIALGDSPNDSAMLEAADHAIIVRSPAHPPPRLSRSGSTLVTRATGPEGWVEGLRLVIDRIHASRS